MRDVLYLDDREGMYFFVWLFFVLFCSFGFLGLLLFFFWCAGVCVCVCVCVCGGGGGGGGGGEGEGGGGGQREPTSEKWLKILLYLSSFICLNFEVDSRSVVNSPVIIAYEFSFEILVINE